MSTVGEEKNVCTEGARSHTWMHPAVMVIGMGRILSANGSLKLGGMVTPVPPSLSLSLALCVCNTDLLLFYTLSDFNTLPFFLVPTLPFFPTLPPLLATPFLISFIHLHLSFQLCLLLSPLNATSSVLHPQFLDCLESPFLRNLTNFCLFSLSIIVPFNWFPLNTFLWCSPLFVFLSILPSVH